MERNHGKVVHSVKWKGGHGGNKGLRPAAYLPNVVPLLRRADQLPIVNDVHENCRITTIACCNHADCVVLL